MKPSPTKLAVLISLLGLGLPWADFAFGADGATSASTSARMTLNDAMVGGPSGLLKVPKRQVKIARTAKKPVARTHTKRAPSPSKQDALDSSKRDKANPLSARAVVGRQIDARRPVRGDQLALIKEALGLESYRSPVTGIGLLEESRRQLESQASQAIVAAAKAVPAIARRRGTPSPAEAIDEPRRIAVDAHRPLSDDPEFKHGAPSRSLFDSNGAPDKPIRDEDESPPMLLDDRWISSKCEERWSPVLALVTNFPAEDAEPAPRSSIDVPARVPDEGRSQSMQVSVTDDQGPNGRAMHPTIDLSEQPALLARASPGSPIAQRPAPDSASLQTDNGVIASESIPPKSDYYANRLFLTPDVLIRAFAHDPGKGDMQRDVDALGKQESPPSRQSTELQSTDARDELFASEQERDMERILSERDVDPMADSIELAAGAEEHFPSAESPNVAQSRQRPDVHANEARPSVSLGTLAALDVNLDEIDPVDPTAYPGLLETEGFHYPLLPQFTPFASAELRGEILTPNQSTPIALDVNFDELDLVDPTAYSSLLEADEFHYPLLPRLTPFSSAELRREILAPSQLKLVALDVNLDELDGFHHPLLLRLPPVASAELLGELAKIDQFSALSATEIRSKHRNADVQSGSDKFDELPTATAWASAMWRTAEPTAAGTRRSSEGPTLAEYTMQSDHQYVGRPVISSAEPTTEAALKIKTVFKTDSLIARAMAKLAANPAAEADPVPVSKKLAQTPRAVSSVPGLREAPVLGALPDHAPDLVSSAAYDRTTAASAKHFDSISERDEIRTKLMGSELLALGDSKLDQMRGGFETDSGLKISFGIERAVYINGSLVTTTSLNVSDLSKLTAGQAQAAGVNGASLTLVQNGSGNTFLPGQISSSNVGTVIQNTLNDQKIQGVTLINATVNSLEFLKGINLQSTIRTAITDSLRR